MTDNEEKKEKEFCFETYDEAQTYLNKMMESWSKLYDDDNYTVEQCHKDHGGFADTFQHHNRMGTDSRDEWFKVANMLKKAKIIKKLKNEFIVTHFSPHAVMGLYSIQFIFKDDDVVSRLVKKTITFNKKGEVDRMISFNQGNGSANIMKKITELAPNLFKSYNFK